MKKIALGHRLIRCENVEILGVQPDFSDYSKDEQFKIRSARKIYYPSLFYVDLFHTMEIETFPGPITYQLAQDKIRQTALFQLKGISHPKTRLFFGRHKLENIMKEFAFPFIAKIAKGSFMGRGAF